MTGKDKCRALKEIRAKIASENDIPYVVEECTHKGSCKGTCPRCESELRYLERELEKRRTAGKRIAVAGICASLSLGLAGCNAIDSIVEAVEYLRPTNEVEQLMGEVECEYTPIPETTGMPTPSPEPDIYELDGDIAELDDMELSGAVPNEYDE